MMIKVYNECENKLGSAEVAEPTCPWPSDPAENQTSSPHFFASDTPDDNDTCQCGRFFYIAAKNLSGA